jgi:hypothetical protein
MYPKKNFTHKLSQISLLAILVLATYPVAFYFKLRTTFLYLKENKLSRNPVFKVALPGWMTRIKVLRMPVALRTDSFKIRSAAH